ncbi:MAG: RNA polymerase sigma-70 factor [Bacteroidota bacterium]
MKLIYKMLTEKNISDKELLDRIKKNDSGALRILFERYFEALCFFSFQILKTSELSEESVLDVFTNIWLKRKTIDIKTNFRTYIYKAVKNQSINYLRQEKRYSQKMESTNLHLIVSDQSADQFILQQNLENEINSLLKELPERRGLIFRMNRIDGLSYKEIAEVLSISVNTVQNQMIKAIKYIAEQLPRIKRFF